MPLAPLPLYLLERVRAEFLEMPGMYLSIAQAARLFDLERALCERILRALAKDGSLRVSEDIFCASGA